MQSDSGVAEYLAELPEDRAGSFKKLRQTVKRNLPPGFVEEMNYGTIGYVVPKTAYPGGYHCDTTKPLPFMNIASQKHFIALYHMGIYADKPLLDWFVGKYVEQCKRKPDMGKSCIRFKRFEEIPYALIGELASKISVKKWIEMYEERIKK